MARRFSVIGPGRLGLRLIRKLSQAGWSCLRVRGRRPLDREKLGTLPADTFWDTWEDPTPLEADQAVFVTVNDGDITAVAQSLAESVPRNLAIFHTSGALTSDALEACRDRGAHVASWHPLQTFPARGAVDWQGCACAIEGDQPAVDLGFETARALGLEPWIIDKDHKTLYHATAVLAGNLSHILIAAARDLLRSCGTLPSPPGELLRPLVLRSVETALTGHGMENLTGPIARGDTATIENHLEVLPDVLADSYRALVAYVRELQPEAE